MTIKVGDRVKMTEQGFKAWGKSDDNPKDIKGTVVEEKTGNGWGFLWRVLWDNGFHNSYKNGDIELVVEGEPATTKTGYVRSKYTKKGNVQLTLYKDMAMLLRLVTGSVLGSDNSPRHKVDDIYYELVNTIEDSVAWESIEYSLIKQNLTFKDYPYEKEEA